MSKHKRPLFADFELHAGNDPAFKNELIVLLIANVLELRQALDLSSGSLDLARFREVCHKVSTTLYILNDRELVGIVYDIKQNADSKAKIMLLDLVCSQVISSLEAELEVNIGDLYPVQANRENKA